MKTILRSTLAAAILASAPPVLAGEDPPDQGTTGVRSPEMIEERGASAGVAVEAPAEGAAIAAAQDVEQGGRSLGEDPLNRSMDAGG